MLLKRLRNLWTLSGMELAAPIVRGDSISDGSPSNLAKLFKMRKMATIVDTKEYLDDIPTESNI